MGDPSNRAKAIFLEAIEKHAPAQWPAFLDEACANDPPLRSRLEQLLKARSELGSFHEDVESALKPTTDQPSREQPGTVIGPYKLLQQIGEGGMGTVYMAEQTQPIQRKVALKIIKPGMDTRLVIARFEAERQALALMDHPNIAKVFDAGTTGGEPGGVSPGRPYFVMELVKGVPIIKYCDEHRLTPRQRLELFVPVCQAIQHAHQKGIIHRDIKPSNVLVAPYDGKPVVKVIDFGIAKAAGQQLTDKTLFTDFGAVVGTLEYMSPEQAKLNNQDIDTRSDIYSLGVLLYELLTGTTPLSRERLKTAAFTETLRMIREEEPPKPSTRLAESKDSLPSISAQRQTEPAKLTKLVRGELDWIVMKALEKDRGRRYETANGFAMDVQRYLADEPVQASPPSAGYRLRKFVQRNKGPVAASVTIAALLLVGVVISTWLAVVATRAEAGARDAERQAIQERNEKDKALLAEAEQRQRAEANFRNILQGFDDLTSYWTDPTIREKPGNPQRFRTQTDRALKFLQESFHETPNDPPGRLKKGLTYCSMANIFTVREQYVEATDAYVQAAALFRQLVSDLPDEVRYQQERSLLHKRMFQLATSYLDPAAAELLVSKKYSEVAELYRQERIVLELLRSGGAVDTGYQTTTFTTLISVTSLNLGMALRGAGRPTEAEAAYTESLTASAEVARQNPAPELFLIRVQEVEAHTDRGEIRAEAGRLREAEADFREAIAVTVLENRRDPIIENRRGAAQNALAWLLATGTDPERRKPAEAVALARQAVDQFPKNAGYWTTLGAAHYRAGDARAAVEALAKAVELRPVGDGRAEFFLAMARWQLGEKDQARTWFDKSVQWMEKGKQNGPELKRFRTEAAELLGVEKKK